MSRRFVFLSIFFFALYYFPLFLHLDTLSLHLWDEARRAVNAFEMVQNGRWPVPHFDGYPDMYGTKPPLLVWLQAIFMSVLGYNELAVRLPSALAGLGTAVIMVIFSQKVLKKPLIGFLGALVLVCSEGYINNHAARTGDYDALLAFFELSYLFCGYLYIETGRNKWLYLTAVGVFLAGLTKGIAGFFFGPALFIFTLLHPNRNIVIKKPQVYIAAALAILGVFSYYLLREQYNPGYLATVWENELGGRYFEAREGHNYPFWHYFQAIYERKLFFPWMYFLPLAVLVGMHQKESKKISLLGLLTILTVLLILSSSKTKIFWYVVPLLPISSLLTGVLLNYIFDKIADLFVDSKGKYYLALLFFVIAIFGAPYVSIIKNVYVFEHTPNERPTTVYKDLIDHIGQEKRYTILHPSYNGHITFYCKSYEIKGYQVMQRMLAPPMEKVQKQEKPPLSFQINELVATCEYPAKTALEAKYTLELVDYWKECSLVRITGKKPQ